MSLSVCLSVCVSCTDLSVCLCQWYDLTLDSAPGPIEMQLGVKIPWDTRADITYSL